MKQDFGTTTTTLLSDQTTGDPGSVRVAKHTPGPWQASVRILITGYVDANILGPNGEDIASLYSSDGMDEPRSYPAEANARLIAAAPDMLAALEKIADKEGSFAFVRNAHAGMSQIARAAISRALGTEHDGKGKK